MDIDDQLLKEPYTLGNLATDLLTGMYKGTRMLHGIYSSVELFREIRDFTNNHPALNERFFSSRVDRSSSFLTAAAEAGVYYYFADHAAWLIPVFTNIADLCGSGLWRGVEEFVSDKIDKYQIGL